jgi:hypothetical protein
MLVGIPNMEWLDLIAKIWPIILSVVGGISYVIGTRVRARTNDVEQMAVTQAVEDIENILAQLVEQKARTQEHIIAITEKLNEQSAEIRDCRDKSERNRESLAVLKGRLLR